MPSNLLWPAYLKLAIGYYFTDKHWPNQTTPLSWLYANQHGCFNFDLYIRIMIEHGINFLWSSNSNPDAFSLVSKVKLYVKRRQFRSMKTVWALHEGWNFGYPRKSSRVGLTVGLQRWKFACWPLRGSSSKLLHWKNCNSFHKATSQNLLNAPRIIAYLRDKRCEHALSVDILMRYINKTLS